MSLTPNYAIPFQALTDRPDGPNLGEDMAMRIDAILRGLESRMAQAEAALVGLDPAPVSYPTVLTNLTLGNGTVKSTYWNVGPIYDFHFRFDLGSTSAVGTNPSFTLPATPSPDFPVEAFGTFPGRVHLLDAGTGARQGTLSLNGASTVAAVWWNGTTLTQITATSPWNWTTGDALIVDGRFYTA
jgi:hypothetical protein